ncbi:MAG: YhcH/YjgK/YiaL family protein [Clostridiales bacterium]|nr:YhcH/YjgK/YiaL family protein [Candidatus Blautia equi]
MIIDQISNMSRYMSSHKNIATALQFIADHANDPELQDGTYPIVPDEVIVHVVTKDTHAREAAKMEIHKKFMDIHYIIRGAERCAVAVLPPMEEIDYSDETDNGFWDCEDTFNVRIGEGEFYAVWPLEPHCPLCNAGESEENVRKFIVKVKVD